MIPTTPERMIQLDKRKLFLASAALCFSSINSFIYLFLKEKNTYNALRIQHFSNFMQGVQL